MVMALVAVEDPSALEELGLRDSKKLSPERREELYDEILEVADAVLVKRIEPFVIDAFVEVKGLNRLEALVAAQLIRSVPVKKIYVDAPDTDPLRYAEMIKQLAPGVEIIAEHGADDRYPVVSAASIVAKVERDRIIRRMEEVYGSIGSGYPHDEETIRFVERWMRKMGRVPSFVRGSWRTSKRISQKVFQRSLEDFLW
ncbi:MAG: ribonuclease HII [Candidatus Diapherotrites archaeon]|nr:ribonuclease HII [Candidatus Diapherotrites archaeon]